MSKIKLIRHGPGATGLRLFGLGPGFLPCRGLVKLKLLLDKHAFWAEGRTTQQLRRLLAGSTVVVTLWRERKIVGFGRATSDGIYRAVLWDVVVAGELQGLGLGSQVVQALLSSRKLKGVERIYLMTTNSSDFYRQLGFNNCESQKLLLKTAHQSNL